MSLPTLAPTPTAAPLSLPRRSPHYAARPAFAPAQPHPRFTRDGGTGLENHLTRTCDRIAAGLRGLLPAGRLEAVLLGGGYGRGEGGVWRTAEGDRAYNDLEFYVFVRGNRHLNERRYGRALHVFGEILTPQAGVDVEFRLTSLGELAHSPVTMFSYDLVCGHRWLIGDDSLLAPCGHHLEAERIPPAEATRLLMNRGSGLLFAQERLARTVFTPGDADFVARNIAKAQLGAGDAVLTALGQYHWSVRERHARFERLVRTERAEWLAAVGREHTAGVEFKLHPARSDATREELATRHHRVAECCREVWLWLERRRLGTTFPSVRAYAESDLDKAPTTARGRNALLNLRLFGARAAVAGTIFRHPRHRILTALPVLLWQPDALDTPALLGLVQRTLRTRASELPGVVAAYRAIWERVN